MKLQGLQVIIFDVDGVLTDGRIILGPGGMELKAFDAKDGHRMKLAKRAGLKLFLVTGRRSEAVDRRGSEVGVEGIFQGVLDKLKVLDEIVALTGVPLEGMAYVGDDLVDLPVMRKVGVAACPSDAAPEVRECSAVVIDAPGGYCAAGRFIEEVLKAQGVWESVTDRYKG